MVASVAVRMIAVCSCETVAKSPSFVRTQPTARSVAIAPHMPQVVCNAAAVAVAWVLWRITPGQLLHLCSRAQSAVMRSITLVDIVRDMRQLEDELGCFRCEMRQRLRRVEVDVIKMERQIIPSESSQDGQDQCNAVDVEARLVGMGRRVGRLEDRTESHFDVALGMLCALTVRIEKLLARTRADCVSE